MALLWCLVAVQFQTSVRPSDSDSGMAPQLTTDPIERERERVSVYRRRAKVLHGVLVILKPRCKPANILEGDCSLCIQ